MLMLKRVMNKVRLNGIQEVEGSNPLSSTPRNGKDLRQSPCRFFTYGISPIHTLMRQEATITDTHVGQTSDKRQFSDKYRTSKSPKFPHAWDPGGVLNSLAKGATIFPFAWLLNIGRELPHGRRGRSVNCYRSVPALLFRESIYGRRRNGCEK